MPEGTRILVTVTTRASPDGRAVHDYLAGETYGPDTDPPMPAGLAATFLREGWGEVCDLGANAAKSDGETSAKLGTRDAASRVHPREAPLEREPDAACIWCGAAFAPRISGGKPQKFCSSACRRACHTAARRWAVLELEAGRLTASKLLGRG